MSDIPRARFLVEAVARQVDDRVLRRNLYLALRLMHREAPIRRAPSVSKPLSADTRERVKRLAAEYPDMTIQDITSSLRLRNTRIVSHILHGKR